jgi:hypothetical protein
MPATSWNLRARDDMDAKVFFSVGAHETLEGRKRFIDQLPADRRTQVEAEDAADPPVDMVVDCERMVAALRGRGYPSLDLGLEVLPGEYHETAPPLESVTLAATSVRRAALTGRGQATSASPTVVVPRPCAASSSPIAGSAAVVRRHDPAAE